MLVQGCMRELMRGRTGWIQERAQVSPAQKGHPAAEVGWGTRHILFVGSQS